ncbi:MAG: hypothetical protein J6Q14_03575, partial [Oscillospiraceae bacterium]|nr:hypothetical protein [Oscillospiraceae bacterium]
NPYKKAQLVLAALFCISCPDLALFACPQFSFLTGKEKSAILNFCCFDISVLFPLPNSPFSVHSAQ